MPPVDPRLVEAFLRALPAERREDGAKLPLLAETLAAWLADARAAWPEVDLDGASFVAHVAARIAPGDPLDAALSEVRAADAYVAAASAAGDELAMLAIERRYFVEVDLAWRRVAPAGLPLADARQIVREKLFVRAGADARPPRIADYAGRGDLKSWLRVTALRTFLDATKRKRREDVVDDEFFAALPAVTGDPQAALGRSSYRAEFRESVADALSELAPEERDLLRRAYVAGENVDRIAEVYSVHRATAARRVARARSLFLDALRARLARRLGVEERELESVVGSVASRIEVTLERFLKE